MRSLEVRRHSLTKKGVARGRGSHLSSEGVMLARAVGPTFGPVGFVLVGPLPRHLETAIAMGYAVDDVAEWPSGYVPGVIEHHDQWRWPVPFERYAGLIRTNSALAKVTDEHRRLWIKAIAAVPDGGTALVISSGGAIEPTLVACLPAADFASWGEPFSHCDGARLTYADGRFVNIALARIAGKRTTGSRGVPPWLRSQPRTDRANPA